MGLPLWPFGLFPRARDPGREPRRPAGGAAREPTPVHALLFGVRGARQGEPAEVRGVQAPLG